jgi:serine/threonine-protein kinase
MGEVWRARDTRLGRDVALKVLPEAFTADAARVARFEREAKLLATLSHPGIAAAFGFERFDGVALLVLELIPGPTLRDRLQRGPLAVPEALTVARQIAEALEAAHEKGIVHRDLKPSNVKLSADGRVKLLDFGLAKSLEVHEHDAEVSNLSTETSPTEAGAVLGTAPYMSPEQVRGHAVDARADVWAFGCVLFEMLTGRRAFAGETGSDVIAAILEREPRWDLLPSGLPPVVLALLRRCLAKDPARRLHHIADARIEIEEAVAEPGPAPASRVRRREAAAGIAMSAALLIAAGAWVGMRPGRARTAPRMRANIAVPPFAQLHGEVDSASTLALAPDGSHLVFPVSGRGIPSFFTRPLDRDTALPIVGSRGYGAFFSPDGAWLGYQFDRVLMKIPPQGGTAVPICDSIGIRGASWGDDGNIVFGNFKQGLSVVSADGGTPRPVTSLGPGEHSHRWPHMLPGSQSALFTVQTPSGRQDEGRIEVVSLRSGQRQTLVKGAGFGRYLPTGHLLYATFGTLYAVPFNLERLKITGPAVALIDNVRMSSSGTGMVYLDVSATGLLVYATPYHHPARRLLVWVDRQGNVTPVTDERRTFASNDGCMGAVPRLSPDETQITVTIAEHNGVDVDVWVFDIRRGGWTRVTTAHNGQAAVWAPNGRLALSAGLLDVYVKDAPHREPRRLTESSGWENVSGWTPDGKVLAFSLQDPETQFDIWTLAVDEVPPRPKLFVATPYNEGGAVFSRDGRWVAYASYESGRSEVYVRSYPDGQQQTMVSGDGGENPMWSRDGRELFYRNGNAVLAVPVTTGAQIRVGRPQQLFAGKFGRSSPFNPAPYDVSSDGRFLMVLEDQEADPPRLVVVPDWFEELRAAVPAGGR